MTTTIRRTPAWRFPTAFQLVLFSTLIAVISALAHAQLVRSTPADKAEVRKAPKQVQFFFNEMLDEGFNTVQVYPIEELNAKTHTNFVTGKPQVDRQDRTHLTASLQPLEPGKYIVDYQVLSRDGHTAPGRITFTVLKPK